MYFEFFYWKKNVFWISSFEGIEENFLFILRMTTNSVYLKICRTSHFQIPSLLQILKFITLKILLFFYKNKQMRPILIFSIAFHLRLQHDKHPSLRSLIFDAFFISCDLRDGQKRKQPQSSEEGLFCRLLCIAHVSSHLRCLGFGFPRDTHVRRWVLGLHKITCTCVRATKHTHMQSSKGFFTMGEEFNAF